MDNSSVGGSVQTFNVGPTETSFDISNQATSLYNVTVTAIDVNNGRGTSSMIQFATQNRTRTLITPGDIITCTTPTELVYYNSANINTMLPNYYAIGYTSDIDNTAVTGSGHSSGDPRRGFQTHPEFLKEIGQYTTMARLATDGRYLEATGSDNNCPPGIGPSTFNHSHTGPIGSEVGPVLTQTFFGLLFGAFLRNNRVTYLIPISAPIIETTVVAVDGIIKTDPVKHDISWTLSYSLRKGAWESWHSYLPKFYIYNQDNFYSWIPGDTFWKHNIEGLYHNYYGVQHQHIIEYVDNSAPVQTNIWDSAVIQTTAKSYVKELEESTESRYSTFNKLIAYNGRQSTGLLNIVPKDVQDPSLYLEQQIKQVTGDIQAEKKESNWYLNDLRDAIIDYSVPMFRRDRDSLSSEYFIDKILNPDAFIGSKSWDQEESLRDKYLVLRLIFDNFDNVRLTTNYTMELDKDSYR